MTLLRTFSITFVNSYRLPGTFLLVILEQKIESRWNWVHEHWLFMPVLCMSNLLWPQQMLSDTRFHHVETTCHTLWPSESPDLTSQNVFIWCYLNDRVHRNKPHTREALEDSIWLDGTNTGHDVPRPTMDNVQHQFQICMWRAIAIFNIWCKVIQFIINLCMCHLSFIQFRVHFTKL
jgi:hypothetical protein